MPADWGKVLGPDFRGRVRFTRYFNCPTGLSQNQTVHLVAEQVDCHAELSINGQLLGSQDGTAGGRYDVTPYLQSRNNLTIIVELPPANAARLPRPPGRTGLPGGIPGEVRLEIE